MKPMHGTVQSPASRGHLYLENGAANGLEAGKFFPQTQAGLRDPYAPDDVPNVTPPADGKIASAGRPEAAILDETGRDWKKHSVEAGQRLDVTWSFTAPHKTRRFNYFLTRSDWNPHQPLARDQFEPSPFHTVQLAGQPYWAADDLTPANPSTHALPLPPRTGHQVLLAVWEVADTGNAFYQVIDLDFS